VRFPALTIVISRRRALRGIAAGAGAAASALWLDRLTLLAQNPTELLRKLAAPKGHSAEEAPRVPYFTAIKGLTISGYYSTKIGLEQELGDNGQLFTAVFEGCTHKEHQI
jgi:hypothetical protein